MKKKKRPPDDFSSPSRSQRIGSDRPFEIVVASNPSTAMSMVSELELAKVALLYGDQVTLISSMTTMLQEVEAFGRFSMEDQFELLERVAPLILSEEEAGVLTDGLNDLNQVLEAAKRSGVLRAELLRQFQLIRDQVTELVSGLATSTGIDQLANARKRKLVRIESANPGDTMDLLYFCIEAAKRNELGQPQNEEFTTKMMMTFVEKLSQHLTTGSEYLIFDDSIARLVEEGVATGMFAPVSGPAGRSAQAMAASTFVKQLPTFPNASVDEVIDIREDLSTSLTSFRSEMVTISREFTSEAWDSDFDDSLQDAWVEKVNPALQAIEESVRENKSLLELATGVVGNINASYPGLMIAGGGALGHVGSVGAIGGALAAASPLLLALRDRREHSRAIRMQPFYFLYSVNSSLR